MWEYKSLQTKLPVFKRELAEDGRASFSLSYVETLSGGNSPVEFLFAKATIKGKLIMALIESGSSVNFLNDTHNRAGLECAKNMIAANNEKCL